MSAKCDFCKGTMGKGGTCIAVPVDCDEADGAVKSYPQIPYGSETHHSLYEQYRHQFPSESEEKIAKRVDDFLKRLSIGKYNPADATCHDCGVRLGGFHHPGCDNEECPKCHRQLLSCGCLHSNGSKED